MNLRPSLMAAPPGPVAPDTAARNLAAALVFVLTVVLLPRGAWTAHGLAGLALLAVALRRRVSLARWLKQLLWLEPFAASVAALALFQDGGGKVFASMLAKSTLCIAGMLLLSAVTPIQASLEVLRRWRVPGLLVTTLTLAQRYLWVLLDESQRMRRARQSRTLSRRRTQWWALLSGIIAQLLLRAMARGERIHAARCARGWRP